MDFLIDGSVTWTERYAPYVYNGDSGTLDPSGLAAGTHTLKVNVYGSGSRPAASASIDVSVPAPASETTVTSSRTNFAAGASASASSSEGALAPANAVDSSTSTRWSSAWANGEWLQVDLGAVKTIDTVSVLWETAFASRYRIQVSTDGSSFATAAEDGASSAGRRDTSFSPVSARYIRVLGLERGTSWGISIFDLDVIGSTTPTTSTALTAPVSAPALSTAPVVSGSTVVGSSLTATTGVWTGSPTSTTIGWVRCDAFGASCSATGSTGSAYALSTSDVGSTLRARVTATNAGGSTTADSDATAVVAAPAAATSTVTVGAKLPARLGQSSGGQYFVDGVNGSDSNPGTLSAPWRTIVKAWSTVPLGSTINVRAGTYSSQAYLSGRQASASNPITIRAYPGEKVLLRNTTTVGAAVFITRASGVRIQGFDISNPGSDGIKVLNASDVEIIGNRVFGNGNQGIIVGGGGQTAPTYSKNVQIWSNRIFGNAALPDSAHEHGIYYGNTDSDTDGIQHGAVGGVIANNLFYDHHAGFHIQVGSQVDGVIITSNTFVRADNTADENLGNAIQIWGMGNQFAPKNVLVVNNAIVGNAHRGVHGAGPTMLSNVVRNNLAYANPLGDFVKQWGTSTLFTLGTNKTGVDPRFVDAAANDFRPQATSPLVGAADPDYAPAVDFTGAARVGAPDIGAIEYR